MCGRFALYGPTPRIREQFDLDGEFDFGPRYNIAPTTQVLIVQAGPQGERLAFRAAFRCWRCIVPANGFYEWKKVEEGGRAVKQPYVLWS